MSERRPLVLVIDDEEDFRHMLIMALSLQGYEVTTAANGSQGIELARERKPDIITVDIKMAGMDGISTITVLRSIAPETPIVVATGFLGAETISACRAQGATAYIRKPFRIKEL